jgi:hypothetical protein
MRGKPETEVRADMNPPSDINNATRSSYHKSSCYKTLRKFECRYNHGLYQLARQRFMFLNIMSIAKELFKILGRQ